MLKKWIERIFIASVIAMLIIAVFLCVYYNVINKDHKGPMDLWAIILSCVPFVIFVISRIIIDVGNNVSFNENGIVKKILNVIGEIFAVVVIIPLFPILLILSFVGTESITPNKKTFKKLINKGFLYNHKDKKYTLKKNETIIEIHNNLTDYYISFDNGESFVRIEESNLGTSDDRDKLKFRLQEYLSAHPVDKQRGDAVPPFNYYVEFLNNNLE